jgi:hypothetical protein
MKAALTVTAALLAILVATPAEANGTSKKKSKKTYASSPVVRVYEPRPAPPLLATGLLGTNLIIWDDLDVDLFDDGDPLPPRVLRYRAPPRVVRYRRAR